MISELGPDLTVDEWRQMLQREAPSVEWLVTQKERGGHNEQHMEVGSVVTVGAERLHFSIQDFAMIGDRQKLAYAIAFQIGRRVAQYVMGREMEFCPGMTVEVA